MVSNLLRWDLRSFGNNVAGSLRRLLEDGSKAKMIEKEMKLRDSASLSEPHS